MKRRGTKKQDFDTKTNTFKVSESLKCTNQLTPMFLYKYKFFLARNKN